MKLNGHIMVRLAALIMAGAVLLVFPLACAAEKESEKKETTAPSSITTSTETTATEPESGDLVITATQVETITDPSAWNGNIHNDRATWSQYDAADHLIVEKYGLNVWFSKDSGSPVMLEKDGVRLELAGLLLDIGIDGSYLMNLAMFSDFARLATYELPDIRITGQKNYDYDLVSLERTDTGEAAVIRSAGTRIKVNYWLRPDGLMCNIEIFNTGSDRQWINGVLFYVDSMHLNPDATMLFPGNIPAGTRTLSRQAVNRIIQADLVTPVIMIDSEGSPFNIFFLNEQEKWRTAYTVSGENTLSALHLSATEAWLPAGESLPVGDLFIQIADPLDPYAGIRDFYLDNGWLPAAGGITDGPLYSAHPAGTMDSGFRSGMDLFSYADELQTIVDMGIEHIWLLPIFDHRGRTDVYGPTDMAIIDEKYGGDEGAVHFGEKAKELGISVLYDYVPHGPRPDTPLALAHPEWCAVDREGKLQIEWDCVSFDMADPDYQRYLYDLVQSQVHRFSLSGARIDCGMGGLPNWNPAPGNRPSNSNMAGGIAVTRVIREAFADSGVNPLILSENFYPIPFYWPYSDLFYDMPFYRMLYTLNRTDLDEVEYASRIVRYLDAEVRSKPEGVLHMRFLGNHDTVSWVFDQRRPQQIYGTDKARALWSLISLIDGIPMLYQGDEDPMIYGMGYLEESRAFFAKLFAARRQWLGSHMSIRYDLTPDSLIALRRFDQSSERLVLVNLSATGDSRDLAQIMGNVGLSGSYVVEIVYGEAAISGGEIFLEGYESVILDLADNGGKLE